MHTQSYGIPAKTTAYPAHLGMARVDAAARTGVYDAGHSLFAQGDPFTGVYRLEAGLVGLRKINEDGSTMLVSLVHHGDFIGYGPLLNDNEHLTSAEVLQPSRVAFIHAAAIRSLVRTEPALLTILLRQAMRDLSLLEEKHLQMVSRQAHARLAGLLVTLSVRRREMIPGGACVFELPILYRDIADLIGIRPETLSRAIGQLRSRGLAILKGREVQVPDLARLIQVAGYSHDFAALQKAA